MLQRPRDLVAALAQLRFNERQAERRVYILLASRDDFTAAMQARGVKDEALARGQRIELFEMSGGAGRTQQGDAVMRGIREIDVQMAARPDGADIRLGSLNHQGEVGDQFAAAPELPGRRDPLEIGVSLPQPLLGVFQQGCSAMQMPAPFAFPADGNALQNLRL